MTPFLGLHFQYGICCGRFAGIANTASATGSCRKYWLSAVSVLTTPRFTDGYNVSRLKWKSDCAGTGETLPSSAHSKRM